MNKSPAFLFYSKDWLTDTREFTDSEVRILIDLMCYNHVNGSLPVETERLARLVGFSKEGFEKNWESIKHKFEVDDGKLFNRKLGKVMGEYNKKRLKNKLIGTFAHVVTKLDLNKKNLKILKDRFDVDKLLSINSEWSTKQLTEWCKNGTPFIVNEDVEEEVTGNEMVSFEEFWNLYDKKVGKKDKLKNIWDELTAEEQLLIMEYIPNYKIAQPTKKYRKNPQTFLNNKSWNDEIIYDDKLAVGQKIIKHDDKERHW